MLDLSIVQTRGSFFFRLRPEALGKLRPVVAFASAMTLVLVAILPTQTLAETLSLKAVIAKRVSTLDRPLLTFHYRSWKNGPETQTEAWGFMRDSAARFFLEDRDQDANMVGPGFYVSVDPAATRTFGGKAPQLYAVTLPQGAQILDARGEGAGLGEELFTALKTAGAVYDCFPGSHAEVDFGGALRNSLSKTCKAEYLKALHGLKVDAILYNYPASRTLANCRPGRHAALNIISAANIAPEGVGFYSDAQKVEAAAEDGAFISELYREAAEDPSVSMLRKVFEMNVPASMNSAPALANEAYERRKATTVWMCGAKRELEFEK